MSFRRFAKAAFDAVRDHQTEHHNQGHQYPAQQYQDQQHQPHQYPTQAQQYPQCPAQPFSSAPCDTPPYPTQQHLVSHQAVRHPDPAIIYSRDIFVPIKGDEITIGHCQDHPVSRHCVRNRNGQVQDPHCHPIDSAPQSPLQSNKFYANMMLGGQGCSVWTHPYSVAWAKGTGNARSWGLSISQLDREQLAFGPPTQTGASQYYINPIGIQSICLSASELGESTVLTTDSLQAFSVNANFAPNAGATPVVTFPLLQGMGFVTGIYKNCTPLIQSSVFFRDFQPAGYTNNGATSKFRIILEDGKTWLLYLTPQSSGGTEQLNKSSNTNIQGRPSFNGVIQVARLPSGCPEDVYDRSAGAYGVFCTLTANIENNFSTYTFSWTKAGIQNPLIMFALPHHVSSFDQSTAQAATPLRLQTTTKGVAAGFLTDQWHMTEHLPIDIGFAPWSRDRGTIHNLSPAATASVLNAAKLEVEQDFVGQCCLDSMYFSGKGLGKFAMMAYALNDLAKHPDLARRVLDKLKAVFAIFVNNKQPNPLVYERSWKGSISTAGIHGDAGADFGNSWYNDHHFHYGYFVYTAAVIGYLDPNWLLEGKNTAWVNMLVRDYANPVCDNDFPFSRSFDWYHGHSWAKGLFESGDGKDEESTSEDSFASYALKMWGKTIGDANMEARGNLMLAIQARTFQTYLLMERSNTVQPSQIIGNKVTGITFENKVDHATYFGMNPEYIQGIHMIPLNPCSALIRSPTFVREEWDTYFSNGRVDQVGGGWRGLLYANLALIDPRAAYKFFDQPNFDPGWLDGGASRTWYLAYTATLGGA